MDKRKIDVEKLSFGSGPITQRVGGPSGGELFVFHVLVVRLFV
jgi:hypothetical protein